MAIPSVAGFPVEAYGAVGNGTRDDSSAIQSAINAACAANGGKVVFGAKIYAIANTLSISCSNVFLAGQGAGGPYTGDPSAYTNSPQLGATVLKWVGSSGGTMIDFEPSNGATTGIKGGGISGIVLAGYGVAGTGLRLDSIRGGLFPSLTVENVTSAGVAMNVTANTLGSDVYDTQNNHFGQLFVNLDWNMPAVRNANGVVMDGDETANTSFNVFDDIYLDYESGIGVEFANADSNTIGTLRAFQPSGYTGPLVGFEASTSPSGAARDNTIFYVQTTAGGVIAYGNGGSGSSYANQILSYDSGNGGPTAPSIQGGASLQYVTTNGTVGTSTISNLAVGSTNSTPARFYEQTATNLSNDGAMFQSPNQQWLWLRPSSAAGSSNPIVQSGDITEIFSDNSANTGNLDIAPWSNTASGIRIVGSSGYVGISTSTPSDTFSVAGNGYFTGGLGAGVDNQSAGTIQSSGNILGGGTLTLSGSSGTTTIASGQGFTIGGSQFVLQQTSGRVGIGTASPLDVLTTNGTIGISSDKAGNIGAAGRRFNNIYGAAFTTDDGTNNWTLASPNSNADFTFSRNGSEKMRITQAGNLGIGTTSPLARLDVAGPNNGTEPLLQLSSVTSFATTTEFIVDNNGYTGIGSSSPADTFSVSGNGYFTGGLGAGVDNQSAGTIQSSGNILGGGTLTLSGSSGTTTIAAGQGFTIGGNQLVVQQATGFVGVGTSSPVSAIATPFNITGSSYFLLNGNKEWAINYLGSSGLNFSEVGSANGRLFLQNGGNVGVGTTSPYSKFEVWANDSASSTLAFNVVNSASTTVFSVFDGGSAELSGSLSQSSDQRLKTNIQSLDASSSLSFVDELNPVTFNWVDPEKGTTRQLGFIAQQVEPIFPNLVSTTSPTTLTPDGTLSLNYIGLISPIVSAIQALSTELASIEDTITAFAASFSTQQLTFTRGQGTEIDVQTADANELCANTTAGTPVCVTGDQLAALLSAANVAASPSSVTSSTDSNPSPGSSESASSTVPNLSPDRDATDTPPQIQINGDNPAIVQIGETYNDLGATITGPQQDLNLGIQTYLNGSPMSPIQIDTSEAATDTIDYVATDQNGLTSTSTRTVIIVAPSTVPTDDASSTQTTDDATTMSAATSTSS